MPAQSPWMHCTFCAFVYPKTCGSPTQVACNNCWCSSEDKGLWVSCCWLRWAGACRDVSTGLPPRYAMAATMDARFLHPLSTNVVALMRAMPSGVFLSKRVRADLAVQVLAGPSVHSLDVL